MVYYFTSRCGEYTIYMGKDQFENDKLIRYGLPEDVWFHVDDLSSAHVYLRQKKGQTLDDITPELLLECCSLVKANSIQGSKRSSVPVVYTRWKNLKKTAGMVPGQVGFHRPQNKRILVTEKNRPIVNALNKTKTEIEDPDLEGQQRKREQEAISDRKKQRQQELAEERAREKRKEKQRWEAQQRQEDEKRAIAETIQKTQQMNLRNNSDDESSSSSSFGDEDDLLGF